MFIAVSLEAFTSSKLQTQASKGVEQHNTHPPAGTKTWNTTRCALRLPQDVSMVLRGGGKKRRTPETALIINNERRESLCVCVWANATRFLSLHMTSHRSSRCDIKHLGLQKSK